jgi:multiple sugar transport system ATP-binding protein
MTSLEVRSIIKAYSANPVVQNVSFTVEAGEFFVIVGPSGCGKSTLMRIICGLENTDSGQIIINGKDMTHTPPRARNIGMVFQDYGLYPNMDVFGNIAYGLQAHGVSADEIARRIPPVAEKLGLVPLLKRNIVDLSGGEQQRVALARALTRDADVYLFDEPLSNLDPKLRGSARRDILWGHREKQKPSVYVTHDQIEAFSLADRIAVMGSGKMQQIGTPDDILNRPANLYVAQFMGAPAINLFDGELEARGGGRWHFIAPDFDVPLPSHIAAALPGSVSRRVILGIRPDAIQLADTAEPNRPAWQVIVDDINPMLGETIVNGRIGDLPVSAVLDDYDAERVHPGDTMLLSAEPERLLLFDGNTETAVGMY